MYRPEDFPHGFTTADYQKPGLVIGEQDKICSKESPWTEEREKATIDYCERRGRQLPTVTHTNVPHSREKGWSPCPWCGKRTTG